MALAVTMSVSMARLAHTARQFFTLQKPVRIGIHAGEHRNQSGAEFIGADHAVAITVEPVKVDPVMGKNLVLAQGTIAIAVDGGSVEHAVLLLATYELKFRPELPFQIILNEAVEIDKILGSNDGHKMVNGVMNSVVNDIKKRNE